MNKAWGVWLDYPFAKAIAWMAQGWYAEKWDTRAHIIACGPIAFAVFWRVRRPAPTPAERPTEPTR